MRLWHQSMTNISKLTKYLESIRNHAKKILDQGVTVDFHGIPYGFYHGLAAVDALKYPYLEFLCEGLVCEAALTAEREGYDAMTIGSNLDTGLKRCRAVVDMPVVGITESSMHVACILGKKFAFITVNSFMQKHILASVEEAGLTSRLACVLPMEAPFDDFRKKESNQGDGHGQSQISRLLYQEGDLAQNAFLNSCRQAIALGAEVLIPGEGVLSEFLFEHKISQCDGAPILDTNAALWNYGIMFANLRSRSNISISRTFAYMKPDAELLKQARAFNRCEEQSSDYFS